MQSSFWSKNSNWCVWRGGALNLCCLATPKFSAFTWKRPFQNQFSRTIIKVRSNTNSLFQGVFVYYIYSYEAVTFGEDYKYPKWAEVLGLCISFSSMIWVILYAIYWMITTPGTLKERWIQGVTPVFDQQQNNTSRSVNNAENLPAEENRLVNGEEETELEETKNDNLA